MENRETSYPSAYPESQPAAEPSSSDDWTLTGGGTVTLPDGSTYEKSVLAPGGLPFSTPRDLDAVLSQLEGWSADDVEAAFQLMGDYLVSEYADSSALDTGAQGYAEWLSSGTPEKYFGKEVLDDPELFSPTTGIVLKSYAGEGVPPVIPQIIRDGELRAPDARFSLSGGGPWQTPAGEQALKFSVTFDIPYRVSDEALREFAAANPLMDLGSSQTDDREENAYTVEGWVNVYVGRDTSGSIKIIGIQPEVEFGR